MIQSKIKLLLQDNVTFSLREIEKSALFIVLGALFLCGAAFLTFEGEYVSGLTIEKLLEFCGILSPNWMSGHHDLFLHEIQALFIVTFVIEIFFVISRLMRGWKL